MSQPKSSSTSSSGRAAKAPAAKRATAKRATASKPAASRAKPAGTRGAAGSTRAAAKGGTTTAARTSTAKAAATNQDAAHANLAALRDLLRRGVVLTSDAVKSATDDAVKRGRLTRKDANDLSKSLLASGRSQADGFRADLEQVLGKGKARAAKSSDAVLREVDRARRRVGVGSSFPISRYDELNARDVVARLGDLSKPELRKVRDYERRHDNRKSVIAAIEKKLG